MAIAIYHVRTDLNHYVGFRATQNQLFDELYRDICNGISLATKWQAESSLDVIEGRIGDFADGPVRFADISVSETALDKVRPLVDGVCELLPFSYGERNYWALYIPFPTDCLDPDATTYWSENRLSIRQHAFVSSRVPVLQKLFRLPSQFEYYCTQEFKDAIEDAGLTGLTFRFVWSSDGSVPKERKPSAKTKAKVKEEPMLKVNRRPTKRDLLLERLWEAIDSFGSDEWLSSTLSVKAAELKGVQDVIAADTEVQSASQSSGVRPGGRKGKALARSGGIG